MSSLMLLIGIFCSDPRVYVKFMTKNHFKGLAIYQCERAMFDCVQITGDLIHCGEKLLELE